MSGPSAGGRHFAELYVEYGPAVRRFVRTRLRDPELVEDTVQETFVRVYRFLDRLDPDRPAWPWIKAIAGAMCRNAVRGKRHRVELLVGDDLPVLDRRPRVEIGPEDHCVRTEHRREVVSVLDRLPDRHRTLLVLKEVEELSLAEIAAFDGTSTVTVKAVLARARAAFRRVHAEKASAGIPGVGVLRRVLWRLRRSAEMPVPSSMACLVGERLVPSLVVLAVAAVGPMAAAAVPGPTTLPTVHAASVAPIRLAVPDGTRAPTTSATRAPVSAPMADASTTVVALASGPAAVGIDADRSLDQGDDLSLGTELWSRLGEDEPYVGVDATVQCDGSARRRMCETVREAPSPQP